MYRQHPCPPGVLATNYKLCTSTFKCQLLRIPGAKTLRRDPG